MKAEDVRKMTPQELKETEQQLRRQLFDLRAQAVTEKLENPRQLGVIRKDIARVLAEGRARQIKDQQAKNTQQKA